MSGEPLGRHLVRGAVGFGALAGAVALVPVIGLAGLLLAPVGLVALRGCPACWFMGLAETLSRGRLERSCEDGVCEVSVAARPAAARGPAGGREGAPD
ncbi:hypothetical protein [Actinomadura verrucosospora]|uniref:Uncharacterized protein n=1 Tax=Actinomadura verrucosospora TaxID=46165 RepID=A0A7D3VW13_ACTVE|nr:hypothetical protein [Actinomadura verrucosospora]QKG20391.1 hypothetical protein ACTIVE_2029 [Actinomadura verrucosospora]